MSVRYYGCDSFNGYSETKRDKSHAKICKGFKVNNDGSLGRAEGFLPVCNYSGEVRSMLVAAVNSRKVIAYVVNNTLLIYDIDNNIVRNAGEVGENNPSLFVFGNKLYIIGDDYYVYDGTSLNTVDGYIPIIAVSTSPSGGGTPFEDVNMLTSKRRQRFSPDGTATVFVLAEKNIADVHLVSYMGSQVPFDRFTVDVIHGTVTIDTVLSAGTNTLEITYSTYTDSRNELTACRYAMLFGSNADERVFLWGNPDKGSYRYHSELASGAPSAEYFPVMNYTVIGSTPITDIIQQYDKQLIFTSDSAYYSFCELKTSISDEVYASYPVYPLSSGKGNLLHGSGCAVNGQPVTLCRDGINIWQSTDIEFEKNAVCISNPIKTHIEAALAGNTEDILLYNSISSSELVFAYGNNIIVYNYFNNSWYMYADKPVTAIGGGFGKMYIASSGHIYRNDSSVKDFGCECLLYDESFGSQSFKGIDGVYLTVKGGIATSGTVTLLWQGKTGSYSLSRGFTVPDTFNGKEVTVKINFFIPMVTAAAIKFEAKSNRDMTLLKYRIAVREKGGTNGL